MQNRTIYNSYISRKQNRIRNFYRFYLGFQQLLCRPYLTLFVLSAVAVFALAWQYREAMFAWEVLPASLARFYQTCISVLLLALFPIYLLGMVRAIGVLAARKDETALIIAFTGEDIKYYGHPILISKRKQKGSDVIVREFYTNIPMSNWRARMDEIADCMNVHFVTPEIEYGGKNRDNSKRIRLYTAQGRIPKKRGMLIDDEL